MIFRSKSKSRAREMGEEIGEAIRLLVADFYKIRVSPLQTALLDNFASRLDKVIGSDGLDAAVIRGEFVELDAAWQAGLIEMKLDLLEFRDMHDWLECAGELGARNDVLDMFETQFIEYSTEFRTFAVSAVGGRVLAFGL